MIFLEILREADLSECNLSSSSFRKANLADANFQGSDISCANLTEIYADGADFTGCNLVGADFSHAQLKGAKFLKAVLGLTEEFVFQDGQIVDKDLFVTKFDDANLSGANFSNCYLDSPMGLDIFKDLEEAYGVSFEGADLTNANLSGAKLHWGQIKASGNLNSGKGVLYADFRRAILIGANISRGNITGARLWESRRSDWNIRGINCSNASWDRVGQQIDYYKKGSFERAYSTTHQIILNYEGGVTPGLLPLLIEELSKQHKRCELNVTSMQDFGNRATIVISVLDKQRREDDLFERECSELRDKLHSAQGLLTAETSLRREVEAVLRYQESKVLPQLLGVIMNQGKTVHIGQVSGNYVDAEKADYVEVGRGGTIENLSVIKLGELVNFIQTNSENIKAQLSVSQWNELSIANNSLKNETEKAHPDRKLISESLASLRKIAESASGSLLAGIVRGLIGM